MKTIAVFHPSNELYGADRMLVHSLKSFPEASKKVVYLPKAGILNSYLQERVKNVEIVIAPKMPIIYRALFTPKRIFKFARNINLFRRFIRQEHEKHRFDLVYVNTLACVFILPLLSRLNILRFTHVHEIIEHPAVIARLTAKITNRHSDYVVCVSKVVENNLFKYSSMSSCKVHCVHNGIPAIQVEENPKSSTLKFYLFGRIMPKKGQEYLLDALSKIPGSITEGCRFVLVGGPPNGKEYLLSSLKEKIAEEELEGIVELKGFSENISGEMSVADVCLIPSLMKDPFPTTVLEAMSAGKIVVTTNHGGAAEVIEDGKNGFLIPPDSPQKFAEVLMELILNKEHYYGVGRSAKQSFERHFTLEKFKDRWLNIHQNQQLQMNPTTH